MKKDIILSGVGGQGILSIATVIGQTAMAQGLELKQAEVHGMSQRGGDVQSNLRLSDKKIWSDLIPMGAADVIISLEPMEALRYLPYLKSDGWIITSNKPFINIPNYPDTEQVDAQLTGRKNIVILDVEDISKQATGSVRSSNMVLLGAAIPKLGLDAEGVKQAISKIFERKGEKIINMNLDALQAGIDVANEQINKA